MLIEQAKPKYVLSPNLDTFSMGGGEKNVHMMEFNNNMDKANQCLPYLFGKDDVVLVYIFMSEGRIHYNTFAAGLELQAKRNILA